jgi:hypothetical protein
MCTEVISMNGQNPKSVALLLSIGTGDSTISRFEEGPLGKYWGYVNAARRLASESKLPHHRVQGLTSLVGIPYFRFNVPVELGLGKMKLDEWKKPTKFNRCKESTLEKIRRVTEQYCDQEDTQQQLKKVAEILVAHRKERTKSDLWGFASSGVQYRCTVEKCSRCQELRPRKRDLEIHLRDKHNLDEKELTKHISLGICPPRGENM